MGNNTPKESRNNCRSILSILILILIPLRGVRFSQFQTKSGAKFETTKTTAAMFLCDCLQIERTALVALFSHIFCLLLHFKLFICHLDCFQRVCLDNLHALDHLFDRADHQCVRVMGKTQRGHAKYDANEASDHKAE